MKIYTGALLAISCTPSAVAFVTNAPKPIKTELNARQGSENSSWDRMVGPTVAGLAGLTIASQMAVASTLDPSVVSTSSTINSEPTIVREGTL